MEAGWRPAPNRRATPPSWAAFVHFGKGGHPAALNFGNCLTYAVAKLSGQPLLCVGNDFAQTDLVLVTLPE